MSRVKKPENETLEELRIRKAKETISGAKTRNEDVSFTRKMNSMVKLLSQLTPIEEQLTELMAQKMPIMDEIQVLRATMVADCIHPITHLVVKDNYVICKFCERKFSIPN
jgi:hypothetical protein